MHPEHRTPHTWFDLSHPFDGSTYHPFGSASFREVQTFSRHGCRHALVTMSLHFATHLDAAWHMVEDGRRLDQVPVQELIGPAVVVDVSEAYGPGAGGEREISLSDLQHALSRHGLDLAAGDGLIIHTGWARLFASDPIRYYGQYPVLSREACAWAVQLRARLVGLDAPDVDLPERYRSTPFDPVNHRLLLGNGVTVIENVGGQVADLLGRRVLLVPAAMKVAGEHASGAPVRLLAMAATEP